MMHCLRRIPNVACRSLSSLASAEPSAPRMMTAVPGPKSKALVEDLRERTQTVMNTFFMVDYQRSFGNYITDADGNIMLDMHQQIASLALGYNHPKVLQALSSPECLLFSANRNAINLYPSKEWSDLLKRSLFQHAPTGMEQAQVQMCGSCAVENAIKSVFIAYKKRERDGRAFSSEEFESALQNRPPGSPPMSILSFRNSFHGRTIGTLSLSRHSPLQKLDVPAMDWPVAYFPMYKYPLKGNEEYNRQQDDISLQEVEEVIEKRLKAGTPVAGVIVEPIQSEGGDNHASISYFRQLQQVCKKHGVFFIVDEVQTGCGSTGTYWAHERWGLTEPPDIVTFSKKMQAAGCYLRKGPFTQTEPLRIANTWMGEAQKLVLLAAINDVIDNEQLLERVRSVGSILLPGLEALQEKFPHIMKNVRGSGTFIAFDCPTPADRDQLVFALRQKGLNLSGCSTHTVRLRPALIFSEKHAHIFLEGFSQLLREKGI